MIGREPKSRGGVRWALAAIPLLVLVGAGPAPAQEADRETAVPDPQVPQGENLQVPEGWEYRLDSPDPDVELVAHEEPGSDAIRFVNMTPGWHVTTGPRVILYHPASRAEGGYRATATFHLFDPGRRNEAFGLFVGGRDLQSADQEYLYFLIRRSGEFLVKLREGAETRVLTDWTPHEAVVPYGEDTEESVENTLTVRVTGESLHFLVNGREVEALPRRDLPAQGLVGWRINHGLDLHVSEFDVEPGG